MKAGKPVSYEVMVDNRRYKHSLSSCEIKAFYGYITNSQCDPAPRWLDSSAAPVSQRSWVRIPFRPEFFSGFNFTTAYVVCVTAMINHAFIN